ncbi:alcohol dehydrogenase catalytic domain-containing protein [Marivirga sp.]|uniref:alcohol dehydrogenase catalytic domain-containing protein n=1 Tax=Marivirga sp. TaxID=2018662 RepID=UPI002D802094|nr:zinc-binding dehydrogenase [Marivirga sp.]HET8860965.1 zinc-binding dehydrogenase [Marivirga sp.]
MENKKAIVRNFGSAEEIKIESSVLPKLQPNEVLIKIEASTVSATDILIRKGIYPLLKEKPPFTLGYDFVGRILEVGNHVNKWKIGDRVADVCMTGGNADYIIRKENSLLKVDEAIASEEAACLVMTGMTAYQIFKAFNLKSGDLTLIHGGAGAIGSTLLQLCKLNGIKTVATASTKKMDFIQSFNAEAIDYTSCKYFESLSDKSKDGFDAAFDFTNQKSFNYSFKLLKKGGKLITSAVYSSGKNIQKKTFLNFLGFGLDFGLMMMKLAWWNAFPNGKSASFYGVLDSKKNSFIQYQADFDELQQLVLEVKIKLVIHHVYPLKNLADAHKSLENGKVKGFQVIKN